MIHSKPTDGSGSARLWRTGATLAVAALLPTRLTSAQLPDRARHGALVQGEMVVTTDSATYCRTLSGLIGETGRLPREVSELKTQGDGMCSSGEVRGGISRLRRALLVLHGPR